MKPIRLLLRGMAVFAALSACVLTSQANPSGCARDVAQSREMVVPPASDKVSRELWGYAANYSQQAWRVSAMDGRICAQPREEGAQIGARPAFEAKADGFRGASQFARVEDGWLVAFNQGEFGAALYWFSGDGKRHYRMSEEQIDPQVVAFFPLGNGLGAIAGLDHFSISEGSIVRITRNTANDRWRVETVTRLPAAPYAIAAKKQGGNIVVMSDSLVSFDGQRGIDVLAADLPWSGLYPNSAVLSTDDKKLYIGMRQYVVEFDLPTRKLRFLLPAGGWLHQLSKQQEQQIRARHSR